MSIWQGYLKLRNTEHFDIEVDLAGSEGVVPRT